MKKQRFEVWCNGHYLETFPTEKAARAMVNIYERQDRYELAVEGYTNALPVYEIKKA